MLNQFLINLITNCKKLYI